METNYDNYTALRIAVKTGVAYVTMDHPPLNVLDTTLLPELARFAGTVRNDEQVRVIVFQSADPEFFIAHGDMHFITDPASFAHLVDPKDRSPLNPMQQLHESLRTLPQVTIAKIAGFARGGGHELAMALDMRFAAIGKTGLAQPEVLMGIIPGGGGTQYLTRLAGRARALEVILGAELFNAELAERYGFINRALPANELDTFVDTLAQRIASLAPGVAAAVKTAVNAAIGTLPEGLQVENEQLGPVFIAPSTVDIAVKALAAGVQTREGERQLEAIMNKI